MSSSAKRLLLTLYITFLFMYLLSPLGATFNGVVVPDTHPLTFGLMIISLGLWGFARWHGKWVWHRTSLDFIFVLWILAFALSVITNIETMRRSMIGLWYMLVYIGVWYALHDMLANNGITRKTLIDASLSSGVLIMLFSLIQIASTGALIAPVSLIGNPNALGAILLSMTPFAVGRVLSAKHPIQRWIWIIYSLAVMANLLLTLSRGAWVGMFSALGLLCLMVLHDHQMLSLSAIKLWWSNLEASQKRLLFGFSGLASITLLVVSGLLLNSFSNPDRRPELRTRLWNSALTQFAEKPITGQGFYTFGRDYGLSIPIPPQQSHAHAHSVPLNILAEMGLVGFSVFLLTGFWVLKQIRNSWANFKSHERLIWMSAVVTLLGISLHHLFDLPSMMPAVALVGLLVLIVACAPYQPQPMISPWRKIGHPVGLSFLWVGLLVTGMWSSSVYQQYLDTMRLSFGDGESRTQSERFADYRETAMGLDVVIAQDPMMPIYHQQQAFVWGMIAESGDTEAIQNGIQSYQRFLDLEPNHAISWANVSMLHWQAGDNDMAVSSIDEAIRLSQGYPLFRQVREVYLGQRDVSTIRLPNYVFNQNYARFEFLREPLSITFLPQFEG